MIEPGFYIANSAMTPTEIGMERFETESEALAKLEELNNPYYQVVQVQPSSEISFVS
jgi:hypothetical protein